MNELLLAAVALGDDIQRFGSYFGYAAIIGLGVLSLLYFAQAREVKRLRDWAGRAPERDAEVAQRVQADAHKRVVAQPIATAAAAAPPASPQTPAAQSADAARMAAAAAVMAKFQTPGTAPATPAAGPPGSLTRVTPAAATGSAAAATPGAPAAPEDGDAAAGSSPAPAPAPGSVEAAKAANSAAVGPAAPAAAAESSPPPAVPPDPSGMSAATAGALAAARQAAAPSRSPAYANGAGGQDTHESDAARPEPLPDLPSRRPRPEAAGTDDDNRGGSRGRVGAIAAGGVAVLVAGVVLVMVLTGGSDDPPATNQIGDARPPAAASPPPPPPPTALSKADRGATPVTVLNGTTQTGLASAVARTIEKDGFTILATETNADQQIAKTTVSYATGSERAARAVAQIMKVPASAIRPIDANTSVAASPEAKIVVLVGSDKSGAG